MRERGAVKDITFDELKSGPIDQVREEVATPCTKVIDDHNLEARAMQPVCEGTPDKTGPARYARSGHVTPEGRVSLAGWTKGCLYAEPSSSRVSIKHRDGVAREFLKVPSQNV
jgi:hypothetical protein